MKKILLPLVAIVLFAMNISAQKQFTGIVKSQVRIEGENIDASIKSQFPMMQETKVLDSKTRMDINQGGIGITIITDTEKGKIYQIFDFSVAAMGVYYLEKNIAHEKTNFDYKYDKNDKKTVAGIECYKVTCTVTDLETDETEEIIMYISDSFLPDYKDPQFDGLKGFPLYTKMKKKILDSDCFMITEITEIKADKKIKPVNFLLPSNAVPADQAPDEIKAMLLGSDDDE